jgi:transposase
LDEPINTAAASPELALIDADLGRAALGRPEVLRLMTISGVDTTVALSIVAAVGDFTRFRTPNRLVSYFGFNPRGASPAATRPAMSGSPRPAPAHASSMLAGAIWSASMAPGPLRPSISASALAVACKSLPPAPPASSPCCAGI